MTLPDKSYQRLQTVFRPCRTRCYPQPNHSEMETRPLLQEPPPRRMAVAPPSLSPNLPGYDAGSVEKVAVLELAQDFKAAVLCKPRQVGLELVEGSRDIPAI